MRAMRPTPILPIAVLAACCLAAVAGCSQDPSGEYREYSQLEGGDSASVSETRETDDSAGSGGTAAIGKKTSAVDEPPSEDEPSPAEPAVASIPDLKPGQSSATESFEPVARNESSPESGRQSPSAENASSSPAAESSRAASSSTGQGKQREVKVLVENRDFKVEGPEGALRVSYDDLDLLKVLNMEPVTPEAPKLMPDWLKNLDGQTIRIRGFMYPPPISKGIQAFLLARDNQICCFGRNPKIYDVFPVFLREGETTRYIQNRPFDVVGTFHIKPEVEGGELTQLYEIDDAVIIEK